MEVPPEIVMFKPTPQSNFKWHWALCQPDACWGDIATGSAYDHATAARAAQMAYDYEMKLRERNYLFNEPLIY